MADIHIKREHDMGLEEARKLAFRWAEVAEEKLDMRCTYEEGTTSDRLSFRRAGVHGEIKVTKGYFVLDAKLGLLLGVFRERIEHEIVKNLDLLLGQKDPLKAFDKGVAKHEAKHAAKHEAKHAPKHEAAKHEAKHAPKGHEAKHEVKHEANKPAKKMK